jgi:hypothetical protein
MKLINISHCIFVLVLAVAPFHVAHARPAAVKAESNSTTPWYYYAVPAAITLIAGGVAYNAYEKKRATQPAKQGNTAVKAQPSTDVAQVQSTAKPSAKGPSPSPKPESSRDDDVVVHKADVVRSQLPSASEVVGGRDERKDGKDGKDAEKKKVQVVDLNLPSKDAPIKEIEQAAWRILSDFGGSKDATRVYNYKRMKGISQLLGPSKVIDLTMAIEQQINQNTHLDASAQAR